MKKIKIIIALLAMSSMCFSQNNSSNGHEFIELAKIVGRYSSSHDLNFTIRFTFADSASQNAILDSNTADYKTVAGKTLISNNDMEALDNKNVSLYVDKIDSNIYIGRSQQKTVLQLPFMDSVFRKAHVQNMSMTNLNNGISKLSFTFNPGSFYHGYEIIYDQSTDLISRIKYYVPSQAKYNLPATSILCITIDLSNYSTTHNDPAIFNEARYYYMLNNKYYPQPAYQNYKIQSY